MTVPGIRRRAQLSHPPTRWYTGAAVTEPRILLRASKGCTPCKIFAAVSAFLALCVPDIAAACRYSVRDVGFIDLGSEPYELFCYVRKDTPQDVAAALREIPLAALLDSNIRSTLVNADEGSNPEALEYLQRWNLEDFPALILVSPQGTSLPVAVAREPPSFREDLWSTLESVLGSPLRDEISTGAIEAHSVVLLVEGDSPAENARVSQLLGDTVERIGRGMFDLPKAIANPPRLVTLPAEDRKEEEILLWSLGLDPTSLSEPAVAVFYGRGRRMGPVLQGEGIEKSAVFNLLGIIGQSCECGLDRKWMQGPLLPLLWGPDKQAQVVKNLGFDAESPMVKSEVSQILGRGFVSSGGSGKGDFEDVLLGYREQTVDVGAGRLSDPGSHAESYSFSETTRDIASTDGSALMGEIERVLSAQPATTTVDASAVSEVEPTPGPVEGFESDGEPTGVPPMEVESDYRYYRTSISVVAAITSLVLLVGFLVVLKRKRSF